MIYVFLFILVAGAAGVAYGEAKYGQKVLAAAQKELLAAKTELATLRAKL